MNQELYPLTQWFAPYVTLLFLRLIGIIEEKDNSEETEKTFAAKFYSWIPFKSFFERKKKASASTDISRQTTPSRIGMDQPAWRSWKRDLGEY